MPPPTSNLANLPPNFDPTPEEESLLELYSTVKSYEREAARLREQAAKAKLAAANEKYRREQEAERNNEEPGADVGVRKKSRKKKIRKEKNSFMGDQPGANSDEESSDEDSDEGSMGSDEETLAERRAAKLRQMREDLEFKKQSAEDEAAIAEERERQRHLAEADDVDEDLGPLLKRKKIGASNASSLIRNLEGQATPPHDFSGKLKMSRVSGSVLFPSHNEDGSNYWSPPPTASNPNDGCFEMELPGFESAQAQAGAGNNTLAVKFMAPEDSRRFSLNIAGPGHRDYHDILFHFNPRQREKGGQVVINDKQEGIWGSAVNVPLSQCPIIFGQPSMTLIIQITGDGYDVFIDNKHCARLEHRTQLPPNKCPLTLQFPSTDDYGNPEGWLVYKVWWGHKAIMATGDLSNVAGVNMFSSIHPRKLFVSGLSKIHSEPEVDLRKAELERAFRKYGGAHGVSVIAPTNSSYAFVEVESERQADLALREMQSQYKINRARRTKHEALQEERAAAEASGKGKSKESAGWD
uniref:Galectin n=1 Tax=Odontella aurita TaxID=265563 RepID=A0A7S4K7I4_9STRA|mmetsp:Transcript_62920/g.185835  ORF Transcript_62920/g.185835 Transcript_62920/m.185835 type:complete len:524 (+) Transcript_62920:54-1625(+)